MSAPGSRSLELVLPAVPASASDARRAVASLLDGLDVDRWPVELVVSEAVANAVVHAYPDRAPGQVRLEAWLEDELLTLSWPTMGWECRRGVIVLASARVWRSFAV